MARWRIKSADERIVRRLARKLKLRHPVARLLVTRRIETPPEVESFFNPHLDHLHDPTLLPAFHEAATRLRKAVAQREKVMVCGDYDVDGITSTALVIKALKANGVTVIPFLPNRLADGYGFKIPTVELATEQAVNLILTVDSGISSFEAVEFARSKNLDVIITDHHEPKENLPNALAVVNPKRPDSVYPETELAGVGVAFQLIRGLIQDNVLHHALPPLLELTAIGTVADVVPLKGENRIIAREGFRALELTRNPGLIALKKVANLNPLTKISSTHIGFQLAPRMNAVGRLGSPELALKLLLTENEKEAARIACDLNHHNTERQKIEEKILKTAFRQVTDEYDVEKDPILIVVGDDWHEGVIGIVASRICDRFFRTTIVLSKSGSLVRGSGRSAGGFHLLDLLDRHADLFVEYGGHRVAAGMSLEAARVDEMKNRLLEYCRTNISQDNLERVHEADGLLKLSEISRELMGDFALFEPYGLGNPKPVFIIPAVRCLQAPRRVGNGTHLKLVITDGFKRMDAIGFGLGDLLRTIDFKYPIDLLATPQLNEWQGVERIQLLVRDVRPG